MQKLPICLALCASLTSTGCSWLGDLPFVYKPDIQQGNVLEQDVVNKLEPGMSKTQVRYVMGTPMVTDVFHQDRWDYVYTDQPRGEDREEKRMTLYFRDNRLVEVEGDLKPQPGAAVSAPPKETVVSVPDLPPRKTGLISRALLAVGVDIDE